MQILTFLRGDVHCTFSTSTTPKPAYGVCLKALEQIQTIPSDIAARISNQPGVLISGPPRTFLKPNSDLLYIPSGRLDRKKGAPHTIFVRTLYIQKERLQISVCDKLDSACTQIIGNCNHQYIYTVGVREKLIIMGANKDKIILYNTL